MRQLRYDVGRKNTLSIHLTLVPYLAAAGELKTKPTQHSVKTLSESGLSPDILVCRSEYQLDTSIRRKIAQFCNVEIQDVIASLDAKSIYEVPLLMLEEGLDSRVIEKLNLPAKNADLEGWRQFVNKIKHPDSEITIALVGKYVEHHDAYKSIVEALIHGGAMNNTKVNIRWIQSDYISSDNIHNTLRDATGVLVAPGFGDRGIEGKLTAVKFARENKIPFFGICLGMQCAVIEYARNCAGLEGANSTEFDENCIYPVIDYMPDQRKIQEKGGTMRLGKYVCKLTGNTSAGKAYNAEIIEERHRHRFELNNELRQHLMDHGLIIAGINPERDLVEIIEIENHPWFVGVQFHPELKSTVANPHPLFVEFVKNAKEYSSKNKTPVSIQKQPI
jgi:CTP synthase